MRVDRSVVLRLVVALVAFAANLPLIFYYPNDAVGRLSLVAIWVLTFGLISKHDFLARLYFLLFGIFFVIPPAIAEDSSFLEVGRIFNDISLESSDVAVLQASIFIFLIAFPLTTTLLHRRHHVSPVAREKLKNTGPYFTLLASSFGVILLFNIREAQSIMSQGYQAYFSGELAVQKNLSVLIIEYIFIVLALFGMNQGRRIPFALLVVYAISLMLTGQRMPGAMLILVLFATAFRYGYLRAHFFQASFLGFGVAPVFFMVIQTLRTVGPEGLARLDLLYYYTDFWAVIGQSLDTLKAAVISDRIEGVDVNLFARLGLTFNVIFSRLFSIDLGLNAQGFGVAFSKYFAPELFYDRRVTFASSGIAESFFSLGFLGVAIYGVAAAMLCKYFQEKMDSGKLISILILFVFAPRFLGSVRNELFGWIFEGGVYFATMYPIYRIMKFIFIRNPTFKANCNAGKAGA